MTDDPRLVTITKVETWYAYCQHPSHEKAYWIGAFTSFDGAEWAKKGHLEQKHSIPYEMYRLTASASCEAGGQLLQQRGIR